MISIGVDLHVRNSYITAIDGESGEVMERQRVNNSEEEITSYFQRFQGRQLSVVVEATSNTYPMVRLLDQIGVKDVKVVNPRKMRVIADSVCKTDAIDSEVLAEFGLSSLRLPLSYIPTVEVHDLRCELRSRAALVALRSSIKIRVHALINGEGFHQVPANLFGKAGREWLRQLELSDLARRRVDSYLRIIDVFDGEISRVDGVLRKHYAKAPVWEEDVKLLMTMPGIGLITSLTILAELGDWKRFTGPRSVANFAGLVPRVSSSNQKVHHGHISKQGPRLLRWVLAEAALVSRRYVPKYQTRYEQIAKRRGAAIANMAIARKMLEHAWLMLLHREGFKFKGNQMRSSGENL